MGDKLEERSRSRLCAIARREISRKSSRPGRQSEHALSARLDTIYITLFDVKAHVSSYRKPYVRDIIRPCQKEYSRLPERVSVHFQHVNAKVRNEAKHIKFRA